MKKELHLVWHEAMNDLYQDRFISLTKYFDLYVYGPATFQGKTWKGSRYPVKKYSSWLSNHWLTYFSVLMIFELRRKMPKILYIHEEPHSLTAFLICLFCTKSKILLESSAINLKGNLYRKNPLEQFVYQRVHALFPKNEEVRDILLARGARRDSLKNPIGNGVSEESFHEIDKLKARGILLPLNSGLDGVFSRNLTIVGYAGRIWEPKGLRSLIPPLQSGVFQLIFCGQIVDRQLYDDLIDAGAVYVGELDRETLPIFYSACDIFILPSIGSPTWREQFGRVCAEAIYCGTPAIGSAIGGIPMVVGSEYSFTPGSSQEISRLVLSLGKIDRYKKAMNFQQNHIMANFSWDSLAARVSQEVDLIDVRN